MPLANPLPPGINICYRTGKHFKSSASILPCYTTAQVFASKLIRTENKQICTLFASWDITGNADLTDQRSVISNQNKSGFNLFQN